MTRSGLVLLAAPLLAGILLLARAKETTNAPSSILVVGHPYRVYFVAPEESIQGLSLEFGAQGHTFTDERVILVEKGLDHDLIRHILFHEVGHACYFEHLGLGNPPIALNQDAYFTEEEAVRATANEMWQVIRDNPGFVRWLEH